MAQFRSILVANRGEIVSRIARTAHTMGIEVVAVYAPDEADAPHVRAADRAVRLEGDSLASTYLDAEKLIRAATVAGADAIHPGYGLLAEDHRFAAAVGEAGLTFIGPSPEAIRRMGLKDSAKEFARATGLPVLPEAVLAGDDPSVWADAAQAIGYPVIVKATAGGGGRAMHVVERLAQLEVAVRTARREAQTLFGQPDVFLEHYLASPRHVEVQVAGDRFGTAVHLFERECSIQRRHQKVVEEAPSAGVAAALLARMYAASVELTRALGYVGVGTVEYLVDGQERFYFLEMNTRIQVEHPVTEAVLGVDLVRLQLEVAMGRPVPFTQESLAVRGHAVEARLYAERPDHGFAPSPGRVLRYDHQEAAGVRYEDGVAAGTTLSSHYDPLLGKVVAHGASRDEAAARLVDALQRVQIHGIATNRDFLVSVLTHPDFAAGATHTDFIDTHPDLFKREYAGPDLRHLAALIAVTALRNVRHAPTPMSRPGVGSLPAVWSPPITIDQVDPVEHALTLTYRFEGDPATPRLLVRVNGDEHAFGVRGLDGVSVRVEHSGVEVRCEVREYDSDDGVWVNDHRTLSGWRYHAAHRGDSGAVDSGDVVSSLPGTVVAAASVGQPVAAGEEVAVIEAMKLEHSLLAPRAGRVVESRDVGSFVQAGEVVVRVAAD